MTIWNLDVRSSAFNVQVVGSNTVPCPVSGCPRRFPCRRCQFASLLPCQVNGDLSLSRVQIWAILKPRRVLHNLSSIVFAFFSFTIYNIHMCIRHMHTYASITSLHWKALGDLEYKDDKLPPENHIVPRFKPCWCTVWSCSSLQVFRWWLKEWYLQI